MRFWYLSGIGLVILTIGDNPHEGDHGNNKEDRTCDTFVQKQPSNAHADMSSMACSLNFGLRILVYASSQAHSSLHICLTLNAPIAAKVVCFSRLLKCLRSLYGKQCGPRSDCSYRIGAVCSGSTLFASILYSSVMLGNYFQQKTLADDIFRCIFFLAL